MTVSKMCTDILYLEPFSKMEVTQVYSTGWVEKISEGMAMSDVWAVNPHESKCTEALKLKVVPKLSSLFGIVCTCFLL